jgi:hypothetical protein
MIVVYYGSYRHWGHLFINYKLGLEKLHEQVTKEKAVDSTYVKALASDLAKKVLESEFKKQRKWFVNGN